MTNQHKFIIVLCVLLFISLCANIYFYSTTVEDSNDDLVRSQQKEASLREQLSVQESKNDSLRVMYDTKKNEIDTFIIYKEDKKQYYDDKKNDILVLDADSAFSFFTVRLSKADSL